MERITCLDEFGECCLDCDRCERKRLDTCYDSYDCMERATMRLAAIEDILGDTYDLDRLRELVEADRDERCVVLSDDVDYIQRQAVIDLLHYYADEACSAIVEDVERIPGIYLGFAQTQKR